MSTTTDPFVAWDARRHTCAGNHLPDLTLQDPLPITRAEAARLTHAEEPLTRGEWVWWASFFATAVCVGLLLAWLQSGMGLGALIDAARECLGR